MENGRLTGGKKRKRGKELNGKVVAVFIDNVQPTMTGSNW